MGPFITSSFSTIVELAKEEKYGRSLTGSWSENIQTNNTFCIVECVNVYFILVVLYKYDCIAKEL